MQLGIVERAFLACTSPWDVGVMAFPALHQAGPVEARAGCRAEVGF